MPNLMSSDPCEMDWMQFAICTPSFLSWRSSQFKTAYGLEEGQEVKLIKEEEKEKSSSCDTQSGAKMVVLGKSGGLSWGQEDSLITSQNVGRGFTPLLALVWNQAHRRHQQRLARKNKPGAAVLAIIPKVWCCRGFEGTVVQFNSICWDISLLISEILHHALGACSVHSLCYHTHPSPPTCPPQ